MAASSPTIPAVLLSLAGHRAATLPRRCPPSPSTCPRRWSTATSNGSWPGFTTNTRPCPPAKPILTACARALTPQGRAGDYAQAVMDLGATICTPRNPACGLCPWRSACAAWAMGTASRSAEKDAQGAQAHRGSDTPISCAASTAPGCWNDAPTRGCWAVCSAGPGRTGARPRSEAPPIRAEWKTIPGEARHTFTHFHLRLVIKTALVPMERQPVRGDFVELPTISAPPTCPR